jgi:sugar phosphate isomerase/epimerase
MQLMVFSKHLAGLPLDEVARRLVAIGIDAIDLTVRPGGHVEPERVEDDLPQAAKILAAGGVRIGMITTAITDAHDPLTPRILSAAANLGITHYKLGYYFYEGFGQLKKQRDIVRQRIQELAALNREIDIHGGFHNHSDRFIGAMAGDVHYVLQDSDPCYIGSYFDAAHATIEGGLSGWELGLDLLSERVMMLAVKDYRWVAGGSQSGVRQHQPQFCPLADGNTPWPQILRHLKQIGFDGPVSLHSEYEDLTPHEVLKQTARDAVVFREWINNL